MNPQDFAALDLPDLPTGWRWRITPRRTSYYTAHDVRLQRRLLGVWMTRAETVAVPSPDRALGRAIEWEARKAYETAFSRFKGTKEGTR